MSVPDSTFKSEVELRQSYQKRYFNLMEKARWMLNTLNWMSEPESSGGITTCSKHGGYGFQSDCAICQKLKEINELINNVYLEGDNAANK